MKIKADKNQIINASIAMILIIGSLMLTFTVFRDVFTELANVCVRGWEYIKQFVSILTLQEGGLLPEVPQAPPPPKRARAVFVFQSVWQGRREKTKSKI